MSDYKHKKNTAKLFVNNKKETSNHPDYIGSGDLDGQEIKVSMWNNENGKAVFNLSFAKKELTDKKPEAAQQTQAPTPKRIEPDIY